MASVSSMSAVRLGPVMMAMLVGGAAEKEARIHEACAEQLDAHGLIHLPFGYYENHHGLRSLPRQPADKPEINVKGACRLIIGDIQSNASKAREA